MRNVFTLIISSSLLFTGCFMQSTVPLSPVQQASYPADLIDSWVLDHNKNVIHRIEKYDKHRLKITQLGKGSDPRGDLVYIGHITYLDGKRFINTQSLSFERFEIYQFERPCPDLILIYLPNPELIDKDIKAGRVKAKIVQDFFTHRIFEESREGLINYIRSYKGKLFVPFRYMIRKSKAGNLSETCQAKIKPLPMDAHKK